MRAVEGPLANIPGVLSAFAARIMGSYRKGSIVYAYEDRLMEQTAQTRVRHSNGSLLILIGLFALCTLIYYVEQLLEFAGVASSRWAFLYSVHDIHRIAFLIPVLYAGHIYRVKGAITVATATMIVFLPRALLISPFPDPVLRAMVFAMVIGLAGTFTGVIRNEFERRTRLEALVRSERDRFVSLLGTMEEGVFIVGPDHVIRYTNPSMVKEFGPGTGSTCYRYLHNLEEPCGPACKLPDVLSGKTETWEYATPNGRTYEVIASPFVDSDGKVCQLAAFRNISKRKQVELELVELNRLKSELISNVSHELRSPLTSIKGIIGTLMQKEVTLDGDTFDMFLTGVSEETDRLASLVTKLLDMSKLEAGIWRPEKEQLSVPELICDTLERQKWVNRGRTFETELEPDLPDVHADYHQVKQVLINLLENAVAYSREDTRITVGARARDGMVEVTVTDQGAGIPAEDLERVFEKFYRGAQKRQKPGGTGLGLAICQAIIHNHDGMIWAESKPGKGSTFHFTLPVCPPRSDEGGAQ
ncbi:MAG: hypothetical protein IBX68_05370 [Dehalococcoidia bacterium]|nr:hypothetical protein [Dehalococcoidia bacterium]